MSAYSAQAELTAAIHANDEVAMLQDLAGDWPDLLAYPVSADMLSIMQRGTLKARRARRKRAAAERNAR